MFKNLVASCLCALSVNSSPLPSRTINEASFIPNSTYFIRFDSGDNLDNELFTSNSNVSFSLVSFNTNIAYQISNTIGLNLLETNFEHCYIYFYEDDTLSIDFNFHGFPFTIFTNFSLDTLSYPYFFEFTIFIDSESSGSFISDFLPYITKIETPYTPPSRNNLYRLLYDFYYSLFSDEDLSEISTGYNMPFDNWLAHTCTIVTLLVLVLVCFLFLKWLFKVISGLILLKH